MRNPRRWAKNVEKVKRARGEEHTTTTGKAVAARNTGDRCSCRRACLLKFTDVEKAQILSSFNTIGEKTLQDSHPFGLITPQNIKRRRPQTEGAKQRQHSYYYKVHI